MLPSTNSVPTGASSFITTYLPKPPSFVTVIVYFILSPANAYVLPSTGFPSASSISADFLCEIIGSTYVCVVSFVGVSFTVATFLICVLLSISCTLTLNSSVVLSPASRSTAIPLAKSSAVLLVELPPTFMLPSTKLVPSGIISFTIAVVGAVPLLLSNVIVYVISLFTVTFAPLSGSEDLWAIKSALFTSVSTSFVGFSFTVAVFIISFLKSTKSSPCSGSTVTSKLTVASPCAGTLFTSIPSCKFASVLSSAKGTPFTFILPSTNVVPAGSTSLTMALPAKPPSFLTVIVYVIVSPSNT